MNKDLIFNIDSGDDLLLELSGADNFVLEESVPIIRTTSYNELYNKPKINDVELIGNQYLADLFPDGIIINGGNSTGYEAIEEGVTF